MDKLIWVGGMSGKPFVLTKGLPGYVWKGSDAPPVPDMDLWLISSMAAAAADIVKGAYA